MKIFLARHGQSVDNANHILNGHSNRPLTELGRSQARKVAEEIKQRGLQFSTVLCSPLSRAKETAEILTSLSDNPKPSVEPLLIERDFGEMTGKKDSDIEKLCAPDILKTDTITYFLNPIGAETFPDLIERAHKLLAKIRNEYSGEPSILLVGHGDMGKMIYAAYYNLPWKQVLSDFHFGNSEVLLLSKDTPEDQRHFLKIAQHNL